MKRNKLGRFIGGRSYNWKGGKTIDGYGYIKVLKVGHPMSDSKGYVYEHRLKMSNHIGRMLTKEDVVHHIDGNRQNNSIKNLQIISHFKHKQIHGIEQIERIRNKPVDKVCKKCGIKFVAIPCRRYCNIHKLA